MSIRDDAQLLSTNERQFIMDSLAAGLRMDGRKAFDMRKVRLSFGRSENECHVEVQLGHTRTLTVVTAEIIPPYPDRPTEGFLNFSVALSPMASASFETGRTSPLSVELARIVERGFRDSRALDTEALCLIAGEKVWAIRCTIHILDNGGNLVDAAALSTAAALLHFRKPEVSISGGKVIVHPITEREPVPLSLHHIPLCMTFAFFSASEAVAEEGSHVILDPTDREELVTDGHLSFTLNKQKELCAVHKIGGTPISRDRVLRCANIAAAKVEELSDILIQREAKEDELERKARREALRGTENVEAKLLQVGEEEAPENGTKLSAEMEEAADFKILHLTIATKDEKAKAKEGSVGMLLDAMKAASLEAEAVAAKPASEEDAHGGLVRDQKSRQRFEKAVEDTKKRLEKVSAAPPSHPAKKVEEQSTKTKTKASTTKPKKRQEQSDSEEETTVLMTEFSGQNGSPTPAAPSSKVDKKPISARKTKAKQLSESDDSDLDLAAAVKKPGLKKVGGKKK